MNEQVLLPCPFCGSRDIEIYRNTAGYYIAHCIHCDSSTGAFHLKGDATDLWNQRIEPQDRFGLAQ